MKKLIFIFVLGCVYSFSFGSIQHEIDSIKLLVKTEKVDSIVIDFYINLSRKYVQKNNDSALVYAEKAYQLANRISAEKWKAVALCQMGLINFNLGNLTEAMTLYNKSLFIAKATNYDNYIAENYKLIGASYAYQKEYRIALNYNKKSLVILTAIKDTLNVARTYGNMAVYYRRLGIYDSSLYYLNIASVINSEIHNYRSLCFDYNNIGSIHLKKKEYKKAEEYYFKALTLRNTHGFTQDLLQSYNSLGNLFHQTKDFTRAIPYFNSCIAIAKELKIKRHMPLFYKNLSETYYELENYKLALENKKHQHLFTNSINSIKTQIFIANSAAQINYTQNQYDNLTLQQEVDDVEKLILRKSVLLTILILIIVIALFIISYSIKHYRLEQKSRKNRALIQAIKGTKKVMIEKEKAVQKINISQENLTLEIATLLNTEVGKKLDKIFTQLEDYKVNNPDSEPIINNELNNITDAIYFINIITTNLMPPVLDEMSLNKAIQKYLDTIFLHSDTILNYSYNNAQAINSLNKDLSRTIYRIMQELITNASKYAKASIIDIEINVSNTHLLLRVSDNGVGFNPNNNKRTGLGLNNVKQRALLYNGEMIVNTKIGDGTEILINMNYKKA